MLTVRSSKFAVRLNARGDGPVRVAPSPPRTAPRSEHSMRARAECVHTAFSHVLNPSPITSHMPPLPYPTGWLRNGSTSATRVSHGSLSHRCAALPPIAREPRAFARQNARLLRLLPLLTIVLCSLSQVWLLQLNDNPHVIILKLTGSRCGPLPP